jgi:hypothetical protein
MTLAVDFYPLPEGYCFTLDTPLTLTLTVPPSPLHPQPLKTYCQNPYGEIPFYRVCGSEMNIVLTPTHTHTQA